MSKIRILPFTQSFKSKQKTFQPLKKIQNNLGRTFYPRLIMIYNNIMEAIVLNKSEYIKNTCNVELANEILTAKSILKQNGYKIKIHEPKAPLVILKNYFMPEKTFRNPNFYISVNCTVYFGGQLDNKAPYAWQPYEKSIKIGKFRYIVYNKRLSFVENLRNIYSNHFYQFVIKYQSNLYIEVMNMQRVDAYGGRQIEAKKLDQDTIQDCLVTEVVMRSSSDRFDWIIWDINNIMKQKG